MCVHTHVSVHALAHIHMNVYTYNTKKTVKNSVIVIYESINKRIITQGLERRLSGSIARLVFRSQNLHGGP